MLIKTEIGSWHTECSTSTKQGHNASVQWSHEDNSVHQSSENIYTEREYILEKQITQEILEKVIIIYRKKCQERLSLQ